MPIESVCQGCGNRLRVADEFAGRRARCPNCRTEYTVPQTAGAIASGSAEKWRMKSADGGVYGPVDKQVLDQWAAEGRVVAGALLQRDGELNWQSAASLYPSLNKPLSGKPSPDKPSFGRADNPFAERAAPVSNNPYAAPMSYTGPAHYAAPTQPGHHGALLLTLSVMGWFSFLVCGILSIGLFIPALVVGFSDLRAMREGRMDQSGHALVLSSVIISGIGVGLTILGVLAIVVILLLPAIFG